MTTTIRSAGSMPASVNAFSKARRWLSVSTVPPDLLDTTTTVSDSRSSSEVRTKSGSDESRTSSSTPAAAQITSGARDEPPMPQSTIRLRPFSRSSTCRVEISVTSGRDVSDRATQPSRLADSSSAAGPQSDGSLPAIRLATLSSASSSTAVANGFSSG